jgi:hypothetical protein
MGLSNPQFGSNPFAGQKLSEQTAGAFTGALGGANRMGGLAQSIVNRYTPGTVVPQTLAGTDLQPYMNPFTQSAIGSTMRELGRQERMQQNALASQAQAANAFGGDRFAIQQAAMNRDYDALRADALSRLNMANFAQAQAGAVGDIGRNLAAQQGNQQMQQNMFGLGSQMGQNAQEAMARMASMGWGMGQDIQNNQMLAGAMQRQQQQQLIDAAKGQYGGYVNAPSSGLETFLQSVLSPGSAGTQTVSSKPGVFDMLGGGIGALGSLFLK